MVREVGKTGHPGKNVGQGKDFTLFALVEGTGKCQRFGRDRKKVTIVPAPVAAAAE